MGNVEIDSDTKLLIILKIPSKVGQSFLQATTEGQHTREPKRTNQKKLEIRHREFFKRI